MSLFYFSIYNRKKKLRLIPPPRERRKRSWISCLTRRWMGWKWDDVITSPSGKAKSELSPPVQWCNDAA